MRSASGQAEEDWGGRGGGEAGGSRERKVSKKLAATFSVLAIIE